MSLPKYSLSFYSGPCCSLQYGLFTYSQPALIMILYKEEKVLTEVHVPIEFPAYFQGEVYRSYFVAVFSDTLAMKISVVPHDTSIFKGTPAEVFQFPTYEAYIPVEEKVFLKALKRAHQQVKQTLDMFIVTMQ